MYSLSSEMSCTRGGRVRDILIVWGVESYPQSTNESASTSRESRVRLVVCVQRVCTDSFIGCQPVCATGSSRAAPHASVAEGQKSITFELSHQQSLLGCLQVDGAHDAMLTTSVWTLWATWHEARTRDSQNRSAVSGDKARGMTELLKCRVEYRKTMVAQNHSAPSLCIQSQSLCIQSQSLCIQSQSSEALNTTTTVFYQVHAKKRTIFKGTVNTVQRSEGSLENVPGSVSDTFWFNDISPCCIGLSAANGVASYSHLEACFLLMLLIICLYRNGEPSKEHGQNSQWLVTWKLNWTRLPNHGTYIKGRFWTTEDTRSRFKYDTIVRDCSIQSSLKAGICNPWLLKTYPEKPEQCHRWVKTYPEETGQCHRWAKTRPVDHVSDCSALPWSVFTLIHLPSLGPEVIEVWPVTRYLPDATLIPERDLAHVAYRLATLGALPDSVPVSRIRLAEAGFYSRGQRDQVFCYCCGAEHSGWREGDNPMEIHRRLSPQCQHVLEKDRVTAVQATGLTEPSATEERRQNEASTRCQEVSSSTSIAAGERTSSQPSEQPGPQLQSFHWPTASTAAATVAASTTPTTIFTTSTVTTGGIPASESNTSIATTATTSSGSRATPVFPTPTNTGLSANSRPLYPQPMLDLGGAVYPSYSSLQTRRRTFTSWNENRAPPLDQLVLDGFYYAGYSDCVRCFYCGLGLKHWVVTDNATTEHVRWRPQCGFLRAIKGDEVIQQIQRSLQFETPQPSATQAQPGSTSTTRTQSISSNPSTASPTAPPPPSATTTAATSLASTRPTSTSSRSPSGTSTTTSTSTGTSGPTDSRNAGNSSSAVTSSLSAPTRPSPSASSSSSQGPGSSNHSSAVNVAETNQERLSRIREENRVLADRIRCRVCHQNNVDVVFLPCGHLVVCETCAPEVRHCVLCGSTIRATAKVYME